MNRKKFLFNSAIIFSGMQLSSLKKITNEIPDSEEIMPTLFIGHGSPMNAIENNIFSNEWKNLLVGISKPKAVLVVSAHWLTTGTAITAMEKPKTIHDFYGFPKELNEAEYPAAGSPEIAKQTIATLGKYGIVENHDWGLDHGTWCFTKHLWPNADVPILQLSIDWGKPLTYYFNLAADLAQLRKKGIMLIGSGNMVHNLGLMAFKNNDPSTINENFGFDWAVEINEIFKKQINNKNWAALQNYESLHNQIRYAVPTLDHFIPLIFSAGFTNNKDEICLFNDSCIAGSLSMTSFLAKPVM